MKKKIKFKGRRYAYGGPTDDEDGPLEGFSAAVLGDSTSLKPATPAAEQSFGQAFKAGRKAMLAGGDKTFMYKGKSYNTNLASDKKLSDRPADKLADKPADKSVYRPTDGPQKRFLVPKPATPATPAAKPTDGPQKRFLGPKEKPLLSLASDRATGYKSQVEETGMTEDERTDALAKTAALTATFLPFGKLAKMFKGRGPSATKLLTDQRKPVDTKLLTFQPELRKGGSVKSSASSRADGIAQRGKTRGRNC